MIDFWESQEALDRFTEEHLMPAMQRAGVNRRPSVQVMPVHYYLKWLHTRSVQRAGLGLRLGAVCLVLGDGD